jgi:hypothetical protein
MDLRPDGSRAALASESNLALFERVHALILLNARGTIFFVRSASK